MNDTLLCNVAASDLHLIAVVYTADIDADTGAPIMDQEILDHAAYKRYIVKDVANGQADRCHCCNHRIKYACIVENIKAGTFHAVGRDCARTIDCLSTYGDQIENISVALLQRAECNRREAAYMAQGGDAVEALKWARTGVNRVAADIASKLRSYGLSDKQRDFMISLWKRDVAQRAEVTGTVPTGRQTIEGTVVSTKTETMPGWTRYAPDRTVVKVLVKLDNGCKVWGNAPEAVASEIKAGDRVTFTAAFEVSARDPHFGFWKRPTKWSKVAGETPVA